MLSTMKQYHAQWLADGAPTPFTELLNLRAYAMTLAKDHYSRPSVCWSPDLWTAYLDDHVIRMSQLPVMIHRIINEAQRFLCSRLIFEDLAYRPSRDPNRYKRQSQLEQKWRITFLEFLIILVHFGGMPARGIAPTSIKTANTITTLRNVFAHSEQIMLVTEYRLASLTELQNISGAVCQRYYELDDTNILTFISLL
ncbi:MAG: hypothetical protein M1816_002982 [Peltula sp. TS41687]|nr:MAG: hypothetical protein M1816_002982 [Peltula sp. TS41687]